MNVSVARFPRWCHVVLRNVDRYARATFISIISLGLRVFFRLSILGQGMCWMLVVYNSAQQ